MLRTTFARSVALLLLTTGAGCGSPCDPDQRYDHGLCYMDSAEQLGADAGDDDFVHFGDDCTETSECAAPTDYCAVPPGQSAGYCTRTGCVEDASLCPGDWTCVDLSQFNPTLPSICSQP